MESIKKPGGAVASIPEFCAPNEISRYRAQTLKTKEPETVAWIEAMPTGSVLWDVGANIGIYSLYAASLGLRVVAIEPLPASFAVLCQSIVRNDFRELIVPICTALSDERGLVRCGDNIAGSAGRGAGVFAPCTTIDHLCEFIGFVPTHIKIDTDGFDLSVLKGAKTALDAVSSVIIESRDGTREREAIGTIMSEKGFAFRGRHVSPLTPRSPIGMDHYWRNHL